MGRFNRIAELLIFAWLGAALLAMAADQIALLPSPPPTPAERAAAAPGAWARWRLVYARLQRRLPQPPPELGEVWTTRTGRICGLVNSKDTAVNAMTRFYTVGLEPKLRTDDPRQYFRLWMDCADTRWVILHEGTEQEGFCASALARASRLGRDLC